MTVKPKAVVPISILWFYNVYLPITLGVCGDLSCDDEIGETCSSCPRDCKTCSMLEWQYCNIYMLLIIYFKNQFVNKLVFMALVKKTSVCAKVYSLVQHVTLVQKKFKRKWTNIKIFYSICRTNCSGCKWNQCSSFIRSI